ncbi:fatty acid synthase alpha subunit Lsd1 [Kickxella alabastrina]|uniref:Fatty acid synthase alpha subunit Lsd1 n=1 Tax=Kickxella alabastrina TaxID=61397 RepID=A0ACC1IHF9_9FUNG|nr:fatty acid synthase alpha subunit Lsd1 [Kickxella alabastrina]
MDQIKLEPTSASSAASETGGIDLQVPYAIAGDVQSLFKQFMAEQNASASASYNSIGTDEIVLSAQFMEYAANKGRLPVSTAIFEAFVEKYCNSGEDIHVCTSKHGLGAEQIQEVVRAYYHIVDVLTVQDAGIGYRQDQHTQTVQAARHGPKAKSALFTTPGFGRLAIFGGQGGMDHYMEETRSVYTTYRPLVRDFVMWMAAFLKQEAAEPKFRQLYQFGLDLMLWLEHPEQVPNQRYMMSVPVCVPLVGLTQLMQVMVLYKTLGMTPGELADSFEGTF